MKEETNGVMKGQPWVRTVTLRDAPSEYYLRTGNILALVKYLSREQIEKTYNCSVQDSQGD
jgi:hypothetical protein